MAMKTMIRQLISKYGIMSVEIQSAFESDSSFTDSDGNRIYPDQGKPIGEVIEDVKADVKDGTASQKPQPQPQPTQTKVEDELEAIE